MRTGRSITMDARVWTQVGDLSETEEFGNDVSAAIETLCKEALDARAKAKKQED